MVIFNHRENICHHINKNYLRKLHLNKFKTQFDIDSINKLDSYVITENILNDDEMV